MLATKDKPKASGETKSQAFQRLAETRLDEVAEKVRIFSNLCGPSYAWTRAEVNACFERIAESVRIGRQRFEETKHWQSQGEAPEPPPADLEEPPAPLTADAATSPAAEAAREQVHRRNARIIAALEASNQDVLIMAETVAMQREVIDHLQGIIDGRPTKP